MSAEISELKYPEGATVSPVQCPRTRAPNRRIGRAGHRAAGLGLREDDRVAIQESRILRAPAGQVVPIFAVLLDRICRIMQAQIDFPTETSYAFRRFSWRLQLGEPPKGGTTNGPQPGAADTMSADPISNRIANSET